MVSNKLILRKLYFKTNKLVNDNNNNNTIIEYDIIYSLHLCKISFNNKINSARVPKYHGDVMMWCPEGDYSVIQ